MNDAVPSHAIPAGDSSRPKGLAYQLWNLWRQGQRPDVDAFLAIPADLPLAELVNVLRVDQWERWQLGDRVPAERYLQQYSSLRASAEHALDLVYGEFLLCEQRGELPSVEEYVRRFPELAEQLRLQIDLHRAMRGASATPSASGHEMEFDERRTVLEAPVSLEAAWPNVPGYEIVGLLGRGGMGVVYQARQRALKRLVALKMIRAPLADEPELARFRAEAELVARLQHPNIVQIYEVGEQDGQPFISLEFVAGGSLDRQLDGKPQPPHEAARWLEILARAVHAAHQAGIIHRDLKPANILLASGGRQPPDGSEQTGGLRPPLAELVPKITDFGLAKRLDEDSGHTRSGVVMGTPSYMAPEQARGQTDAIGPAVDVYALGALLYEMLTGRPPFQGTTVWDTLDQVRTQEPVPPSRLQPKVPRDLETICLKCLRKESGQRYGSAAALAEDLRRFQAGEPILARPVRAWERTVKWTRRRPAAAAALATAAALVVSLAALGLSWYDAELTEARTQLAEQKRLEGRRAETQTFLFAGRDALQARDWPAAKLQLEKAWTAAGSETALADLRAQAEGLLAGTSARQQTRFRFDRFTRLRDAAMLHSAQVIVLDLEGNLRQTRATARAALDLYRVMDADSTAPDLGDTYLDATERSEIRTGCYDLLLTLAEALARPLEGEDVRDQACQARAVLDRAARLAPPTQAYHLLRGNYLAQAGDEAGAAGERVHADALKEVPAGAVDHFLMGFERYQRHAPEQALVHFENALRREPTHFWAEFLRGICYLKCQRLAEAQLSLSACLKSRPGFTGVYLLRGFAHTELARLALAGGRRAEAEDRFRAAEADFDRAADLEHNEDTNYILLVNRGVLRIRQRQFEAAVHELCQAVRLRPLLYPAYVNLAEVYAEQGRFDEAVAQLDQAIAREGKLASLYRSRARLHLKRHDLKAALRDLDQAIQKEPAGTRSLDLAVDQKERGLILMHDQRYAEAVAAYAAALRIRPDYVTAQRLRAEALMHLERHEEAVAAFDAYLKVVGSSPDWYRQRKEPVADVYRMRAACRAKLGRHVAALDDYTRALELEPDSPTHALRGWMYLVTAAPQLALQDFEEAIRRGQKNADAYSGRGHARVLLGQYQAAVADAEEAIRLGPESARLLYNAARIFAAAVTRVEAGPGPVSVRPGTLRAAYEDRAVGLLRSALAALPTEAQRLQFWRDYVRADAALGAVRRHPAFGALAAAYTRTREEAD